MRGVKASTAALRVGAMGSDLEVEHGGYPAFAEPKVQPIQACRCTSVSYTHLTLPTTSPV